MYKKYLYVVPLICLVPTTTTASQLLSQNAVRSKIGQIGNLIKTHQTLSTLTAVGVVLALSIYRWRTLPNSLATIDSGSGQNIAQNNDGNIVPPITRVPTEIDLNSLTVAELTEQEMITLKALLTLNESHITQLKDLLGTDGVAAALEGSKRLHALFEQYMESYMKSPEGQRAIQASIQAYMRSSAGHNAILNPLGAITTESGRIHFPEVTVLSGEHAKALDQASIAIKKLQSDVASIKAELNAKPAKNIIDSLSEKVILLEKKIQELDAQINHLSRRDELER